MLEPDRQGMWANYTARYFIMIALFIQTESLIQTSAQ